RAREIAVALGVGRNGLNFARWLRGPPLLVREEVEQLVFPDGIAEGTAPDILPDDVLVAGDAVGQAVQGGIAAEVIRRAMEIVGTRLHGKAERATRAEAELGVNGV